VLKINVWLSEWKQLRMKNRRPETGDRRQSAVSQHHCEPLTTSVAQQDIDKWHLRCVGSLCWRGFTSVDACFNSDVMKIPIKRKQSEACFNYAGHEVFGRCQRRYAECVQLQQCKIYIFCLFDI